MLIENFESRFQLGVPEMDDTHREFVELVNQLGQATKDDFPALFAQLLTHTEDHFAHENSLMETSGFPALREHQGEHQRVLGELARLSRKVEAGSIAMARAFVREQIPAWFQLHAMTMDSALAAHLKHKAQTVTLSTALTR